MSRKKSKSPKHVPTDFYQGSKQKYPTPSQSKGEQPPSGNPDIVKHLLPILLILIISIAIYSNSLKNGFVYDDEFTIVNNTLIKNFGNISKLFTKEYFSTSAEMSYRPVVTFTYFIDYALYGIKPWGYHLTNVLLHAVNGVILYIFLTLFIHPSQSSSFNLKSFNLQSSIFNLQLLISLLFATHPVLTETVNAISFREDLLCFLFYISALILYISLKAQSSKLKATTFSYILSCLFYFLALLSKEMAITFPLIIILYEWIYGKKIELSPAFLSLQKGSPQTSPPLQKGRVRVGSLFNPYLIGHIAVTCFYLYLRFFLFHNPVEENISAWAFSERLMTIPYLILKYLILLVAPISLSADYVITPVQSIISLKFIIPFLIVLVLVSVSVNSVRASKTQSPVTSHQLPVSIFGILFFLITLLPVYNIIPIANPFAERYLYLPMAGFTVAIGLLIAHCSLLIARNSWRITHRSSLIAYSSLFIIIISIYSFAVIQRNKIWLDDYSLWSDTVIKMPESARAHHGMGIVYFKQGRLYEAMEELKLALSLKPGFATDAHNIMGLIYEKQGQIKEAIKEFRMALSLKPDLHEVHYNLGLVYAKQGQIDEAIKEFRMALSLKANYADAHNNLGIVYAKQGHLDEAIDKFLTALKLNPADSITHYNMALAYNLKGLNEKAIEELEFALKLKPDYTQAREALESLRRK